VNEKAFISGFFDELEKLSTNGVERMEYQGRTLEKPKGSRPPRPSSVAMGSGGKKTLIWKRVGAHLRKPGETRELGSWEPRRRGPFLRAPSVGGAKGR
jgi:hypothetical protein